MSNQQPCQEEHISDISSDDTPPNLRDTPTTSERRMCVYDRFPFLEKEATEEGAKEIAEWATNLNIADYPDKYFGSFVREVVESKTKDRLARDNEECLADLEHKQSEVIAHQADDTIGSITATVTKNVRADVENFPAAKKGGGAEMIFGRSKHTQAKQ